MKLFNAIYQAQRQHQRAGRDREPVNQAKSNLMDQLEGAAKNVARIEGGKSIGVSKEADQSTGGAGWDVLRDGFVGLSGRTKLKDWDKEEEEMKRRKEGEKRGQEALERAKARKRAWELDRDGRLSTMRAKLSQTRKEREDEQIRQSLLLRQVKDLQTQAQESQKKVQDRSSTCKALEQEVDALEQSIFEDP